VTEHSSQDRGTQKSGEEPKSQIARLFDIRLVVGAVLTIYGVVLLIKGLFDSGQAIRKAAGAHINLWTGVGLLAVGLFFLLWMRVRPLDLPMPDEEEVKAQSGTGEPRA